MKKFQNNFLKKLIFLLVLISLHIKSSAHEGHGQNHIYQLNTNYQLYLICKNDVEGFSQELSGGTYDYPTIREDIRKALISRATTGKMAFEFLTGIVPINYTKAEVSFFFLSDIDLNLREPYDIFVNDKKVLTFKAKENGRLELLSNPGKGNANFYLVKRDHNNDGMGAFRLTVPAAMVEKGKKANIKVQGQKKSSNSWFMIFKATDVIKKLKISVEKEISFSIKQFGNLLLIDAPSHFANKQIAFSSDGKKSKKVTFVLQGEIAKASLNIRPPKKSFMIYFEREKYEIDFPENNGIINKSDIYGTFTHHFTANNQNGWRANFSKLYRPDYFNAYRQFFSDKYQHGLISILNSSHQDIAWVDRPEACIILRDTMLLTPIIRDAFARNDYGFDIEDGLMLREYLKRHPNAQEKISNLLNKKLISVGASYNCPYEDMYDAEDQVRQLYLGKKWIKKTFNGYDSKVYWNVDVPGKTLQYPQILKKAGVDYMVISRHARGLFHWQSPDGSSVFTYSPGHYGEDIIHLSKEMGNKINYAAEQVVWWDKFYNNTKNHTPLLSDQDMLPAIDYSTFIKSWNNVESVFDEKKKKIPVYFPGMELMTMDEFMPLAEKNANQVDTISGERPNVWVYIHGPAHHYAISASRRASKLLPAAEKFLSIAHLIDPFKMPYPSAKLSKAWQAKIYPDHGWGGHDGDVTDNLFKEQLVKSENMGKVLLNKATNFIAGRIKTNDDLGIPIVLFNSLSWKRTDPVSVSIDFQQNKAKDLQVFTKDGQQVNSQLANTEFYQDGSIKSVEIVFIAKDVPSIGYKTYYVKPLNKVADNSKKSDFKNTYENKFYKISFEKGGISQITDKELNKNLFKTDNFKVGEVFTLQSVGNGAGEFGDIQQPSLEGFDKMSKHQPKWKSIDNGSVFSTYQIKQKIKHAIVEQDVTIYHQLKRIYFKTGLLNWTGELYREFRTAFPLDLGQAQISHEVPFGKVRIGKDEIISAGERYTPLCKNVHPRAIVDYIAAKNERISVTLSSSVAAADWIDPTNEENKALLQHILLASRTSCHWEGNEYSQAGNHFYDYVLTSNKAGEIMGSRIAKQKNEPFKLVINPEKSTNATLPEELSFFNINKHNVIIAAVKKAEDEEGFIIRMYDTEGKDSNVAVNSFFDVNKIYKTNIIEENPTKIKEIRVGKFSIETFLLKVK